LAGSLAVPILDFLSSIGAVHLGAWLGTCISLARRAFVGAPGMAYAIPGLTWALVHEEAVRLFLVARPTPS
jgi:hypothetical protein